MSHRKKITTALAVVGLAVSAAPAAAQTSGLPLPSDEVAKVPAGQVEHTVTTIEVQGSKAVPSHRRIELWLSRNRARQVVTDAGTGKVLSETAATLTETRHYDAAERRVTIIRARRAKGMPWNAAAFEAAVQKAYVEQGITKVVGEKLVGGRRALITQSVPGRWRSDEPTSVTTAVVDAETFRLYERTTSVPDGRFSQTAVHSVVELLPAASSTTARLAMKKRPGAKVRTVTRKRG